MHVLEAPAQLVVASQLVEILFETQDGEYAREQAETHREVALLKPGKRPARDPNAIRQLGERHAPPHTSEAQALAKRRGTALGLWVERITVAWHVL
jgi:hypothetical protein